MHGLDVIRSGPIYHVIRSNGATSGDGAADGQLSWVPDSYREGDLCLSVQFPGSGQRKHCKRPQPESPLHMMCVYVYCCFFFIVME